MGAYQRKLKGGIRWRYKGYHKGTYYSSPAKYDTKQEALTAERIFLAGKKEDTLEYLTTARMNHLRVNNTSPKHWRQNEADFEIAKKAWGADTPVREITRSMVQRLIVDEANRRMRENISMHSVNKTIRSLKAFFNFCINDMEIAMLNPFSRAKFLPVSDEKKYIPSELEFFLVRQSCTVNQMQLFDFVAETGCRITEALRLRGEDIIEGNTVRLYTRKAKNSNLTARAIPRPKCLLERMLPANSENRVFDTWTIEGEPDFLVRHIEKLIREQKKQGISPKEKPYGHWNWHNLRHRAASLWARANMPIFEISQRLGHANVKTTQIYLQNLGFSPVPFTQYGENGSIQYEYDYYPEEFEGSSSQPEDRL